MFFWSRSGVEGFGKLIDFKKSSHLIDLMERKWKICESLGFFSSKTVELFIKVDCKAGSLVEYPCKIVCSGCTTYFSYFWFVLMHHSQTKNGCSADHLLSGIWTLGLYSSQLSIVYMKDISYKFTIINSIHIIHVTRIRHFSLPTNIQTIITNAATWPSRHPKQHPDATNGTGIFIPTLNIW